uniref:Transthyretin-like family protein n=1 Tax=Ditylenchus dipsaci TaxID=166011 RepID=A0A915DT99_9BILA
MVEDESGVFMVEGCASDQDWIPGVRNRPEFYIKVLHYCNSDVGEHKTVLPIFRVYTPATYDYHIEHPIELD